ncbi:Eco57I restriction-modification methylase domain-containing protein [Sphingobacterium multivorum]|uniref:Eco57I restriction-modification methylase domain-containing protein n=1 Tax=Sphingobacterium multivorum TaxID=28454 RepID=UPI003DA32400
MPELEEIYAELGLDRGNGLCITAEANWKNETSFPNRVQRLIERKLVPDAFFNFDNKPFILFYKDPSDRDELYKAIWNFNETPIVIISDHGSIEIFNGFNYLLKEQSLEKLGGKESLSNFKYFELVTGRTWEQYQENLNYKNRVDFHLLDNIKAARKVLINQYDLDPKIANSLIGKIIFVRYLIDRQVKMKFDEKSRIWNNNEFCDLLKTPASAKAFFDYLEDRERGFNGDLFSLTEDSYLQIDARCFEVLRKLLLGDNIETNQQSLFELYDFSIIPIEFISNVYELFIGQDNQKNEGAYYTPLFLVDYILKETVEKYLNISNPLDAKSDANGQSLAYCRVLDPACGSGIFLVETLRKIIEKFIVDTNPDVKSQSFKNEIKNIAKENIFGVDKDPSAVQVAVFSIYLTLLDYLEPPSIETFKFPNLLNSNFFAADFFDETHNFQELLGAITFQFILGNPPWMRGSGDGGGALYVKYIKSRQTREKIHDGPLIEIGNKEIAQAFVLRAGDFCSHSTKCALIVTSKVLYNIQSKSFRKYFLHNFLIQRVFELAPVRREVFDRSNDKAIAPACILFYQSALGQNTDGNTLEHFSLKPSRFFKLFKVFTINRHDYKKVQQSLLKSNDWLWKVLVYGSYLDFNFLQRLKENLPTIGSEITSSDDLIIGQGVMVGGGDENDASDLVGLPYINTRTDIDRFWVNGNPTEMWLHETVHRTRNKSLYEAPMLLITEGVRNDLRSVCAVSKKNAVYKSSLTGIKSKGFDGINKLRQFAGVLNSSFFAYFNLMTFSSSGIEREQSHDIEKLNVPYIPNSDLGNMVEGLEMLCERDHDVIERFKHPELPELIKSAVKELDRVVTEAFVDGKNEAYLLDYANTIIIPTIMKHDRYLKLSEPMGMGDSTLLAYANVYLERFKEKLDTEEQKFAIEIWHTKNVVGMLFKQISVDEYGDQIYYHKNDVTDKILLSNIIKLGSEKVTERLFIQKDVRGFEKDYFYIFKPNEKRLWHPAIGLVDVNEFANAMLKAGRAGR